MAALIEKISREEIVNFLSKIELFAHVPASVLQDFVQGFQVAYCSRGEILIQQYEVAECIYILMYGRLRVVKIDERGREVNLGEISSGSVVGEIALLIDEPRTATIYAARDSILLKMSRDVFMQFFDKYPKAILSIIKQSVKRLVKSEKKTEQVISIALLPLRNKNHPQYSNFIHAFIAQLAKQGEAILLTQEKFNEMYGSGWAQAPIESDKNSQIISWLHELESKYKYIIYEAEPSICAWSFRCIRQADRVLLVGNYADSPAVSEMENVLFGYSKEVRPTVDLVLLFEDQVQRPVGVNMWLGPRKLDKHYFVKVNAESDIAYLTRLVTGTAFGLVLSGGGALGLAHVGVLRALEELKIPIDYIAGTSMGAVVAGLYICDPKIESLVLSLRNFLTRFDKNRGYTFPIVSLLNDRKVSTLLAEAFGKEIMIEDLWRNFFCVSTNIIENRANVHTSGCLWKAVRASISLPAFFPPHRDDEGNLLIDGGVVNNLPVDIMQAYMNSGKVIASRTISAPHSKNDVTRYYASPLYLIGKQVFSRAKNREKIYPTLGEIVMEAMMLGSIKHQENMMRLADYRVEIKIDEVGMLDFKYLDRIVELGYRIANEQLAKIDISKN